jgi:hypothetical protein
MCSQKKCEKIEEDRILFTFVTGTGLNVDRPITLEKFPLNLGCS